MTIVKNESGSFYIPEFDFNGMGDIVPLFGYYLKMTEAAELIYRIQLDEGGDEVASLGYPFDAGRLGGHASTGSNMSLLLLFDDDMEGDLGVYSDGVLVGSTVLSGVKAGLAIWGDDITTEAVDGALAGTALELRFYDGVNFHDLDYRTIRGEGRYSTDGVWVVELGNLSEIPTEFGIESAYPNPFNSRSLVRFGLTEGSAVSLHLYDLAGRLVRDISLGSLAAGSHTVTVDGTNLSSGVYVLELVAGAEVSRQKLALVK
jgi:hypothetical protein